MCDPLVTEQHGGSPEPLSARPLGRDLNSASYKLSFHTSLHETETERLWGVSLIVGDQILLRDDEARGFWRPGVFLSEGRASGWPTRPRVSCRAGGADPEARGELVTGRVKGLSQLTEGAQKAAGAQAVCGRRDTDGRTGGPPPAPSPYQRAAGRFEDSPAPSQAGFALGRRPTARPRPGRPGRNHYTVGAFPGGRRGGRSPAAGRVAGGRKVRTA